MARKRRKSSKRGVDIRPKGTRKRKPWNKLASSTKSYWRGKVDIRSTRERRKAPLDRLPPKVRAVYTRPELRTARQRRYYAVTSREPTKKLPKSGQRRIETLESLTPAQRRAVQSELEGQGFGQFESVRDYDAFREDYKELYGEYPDSQIEEDLVLDQYEDIWIDDNEHYVTDFA